MKDEIFLLHHFFSSFIFFCFILYTLILHTSFMPIFWWYLLKNYLRVLSLAVFSFITILLVTRLEEIAEFAAMGAKLSYVALFILYQIPYILPIAIPISCLISSLILFQRLSHTYELTALRAGGLSLYKIISPILCAAAFLSLANFYIASELATSAHLATRRMVYDLSSVNPILLLQNAKIVRLQNAFIQMSPIRNGEAAQNLVIGMHHSSGKRLNLCLAKKIEMREGMLIGKQVSLISSSPTEKGHDHLIIENQQEVSSAAPQFAALLSKSGWKIANDHLKLSLLRIRKQDMQKNGRGVKEMRIWKKCQSEIVRRISIGFAVFTFTLMGVAFGMEISRHQKKRGLFFVLLLSAGSLIAFCVGKELSHIVAIASLAFLLPHVVIILATLHTLRRVNRGIE